MFPHFADTVTVRDIGAHPGVAAGSVALEDELEDVLETEHPLVWQRQDSQRGGVATVLGPVLEDVGRDDSPAAQRTLDC